MADLIFRKVRVPDRATVLLRQNQDRWNLWFVPAAKGSGDSPRQEECVGNGLNWKVRKTQKAANGRQGPFGQAHVRVGEGENRAFGKLHHVNPDSAVDAFG
jgi:hypothetical protein